MNKIKYKSVLVTGGAGFIGSHLVERLLKDGCRVTVIDDLSEGKWENLPKNPRLTKHKVSILSDIGKYFKGQDVVFHLAALPRLRRSIDSPWETHEVNVDGTLKVLMEAKKNGIKKVVFASSSSIYGNQKTFPLTEGMKPNPLVPYSLHKLIGEEYCKIFSDIWGLSTISLRYFNVFGPRMNPDSPYANLLPRFIKTMSQDKIPVINGTGKHSRDFTYVSDVVEATVLAANSKAEGVFNVGRGKSISVNAVVKTLNKLMGKNITPKHGPAVIEPIITLASNKKAKKVLGWKPLINFEDGVKTML